MDDLIEQMAAALDVELPTQAYMDRDDCRRLARAALAVIAAHPRYELVELPETTVDEFGEVKCQVHLAKNRDGYLRIEGARENRLGGTIPATIASLGVPTPIGVADARSYAAALLAAAKAEEAK